MPEATYLLSLNVLAAAAVALAAGCDQGGGHLHGAWLQADDCKAIGKATRFEPFDMSLTFASVTEKLGSTLIRLSPSANQIDLADQLAITIDSARDLRAETAAGTPVTLQLQGDGQGDSDLSLILLGRCAHTTQPIAAQGTLTFYAYGSKSGQRVRGDMAFDLVDRRTGEVVGEGFTGDFDFTAQTGAPHTAFSPNDY